MIEIPPLTPELLADLGKQLGGCDFTDPSQLDFLAKVTSCDVQAAPGNGKTTLLAAKLALLSRSWSSRRQGICVISHTNTARTEVEDLIASHPTAARLMAYPHFTGTVTAFINQYLALPYLRGLGWCVRQIDDAAFEAAALRRYPSYPALKRHAHSAKATVENWVSHLDLDPAFTACSKPTSLLVRRQKGQHGADTKCGQALASLKASMVKSGLFRYSDMLALARRALSENPTIAQRLCSRFPLVLLDEAQDTHGDQLKLLEDVFQHGSSAFQRLGDSNQTLYEDDSTKPVYWIPGSDALALDTSRRFSVEIAEFASRLTVRKPQKLVGLGVKPAARVMILFDKSTIGRVIPAFADEARAFWGSNCSGRNVWAVASRHSPAPPKGPWPKSLVDYHPDYRSESEDRTKANLLCRQFQKAVLHHGAAQSPAEVMNLLTVGVSSLAALHNWTTANGRPLNAHNFWQSLEHRQPNLGRALRRLLREHVLTGDAVWTEPSWSTLVQNLLTIFAPQPPNSQEQIAAYCDFVAAQRAKPEEPSHRSTKQVQFGDLVLRLGSIHSVKGKSVDGILVLESQVWKGSKTAQQCIDLRKVLPLAFGLTTETLTEAERTAATNVFVGVTRTRQLLGLALLKSEATKIVEPARVQGWKIVDLTVALRTLP